MGALLWRRERNGDGVAGIEQVENKTLTEPMAMKPTSVVMAAKRFPAP